MEAFVFTSSMSILVNESETKEFQVEKGLHQGHSLLSSFFVLSMEGPTRLVKKANALNEFSRFLVNDAVYFDILQFSDDTNIAVGVICGT